MGRVLLADMDDGELGAYLHRARLEPLTRRTVTDAARLRGVLQQVATQGFAVVDQELEDGLRSAAAPIVDASGAVAAAMNVSVHASRVSLADLRRTYVPQLVATAGQISADLQRLGVAGQRRLR